MTEPGGARPTGPAANAAFTPAGAVVVVTGGASGIGAALGRRLHRAGAAVVVLADIDGGRAGAVAELIAESERLAPADPAPPSVPRGTVEGIALDVADPDATLAAIDGIEARHGPIDLFCANAGIATGLGAEAPPGDWQRMWDVNVMAHVHAARALLPRWHDRGRGHLLVTASAAGLLTNLGDAPYSVTKHAAVAFAEWVAITHGPAGVGVSCLCPQGVRTPLLFGAAADEHAALATMAPPGDTSPAATDVAASLAARVVTDQHILEPDDVAEAVFDALAEGRFLVLPHPEVAGYEQARAGDHDRWIRGMRKLQTRLDGGDGSGS